ncbi:unnamed protein product [Rotaria magnacalcarata]|uniref:ABC transporter domain-containing protein n=3 Tax=Rotaria magnacalcarata TaxID=392030 RepID=A0A819Z0K4_9BILA|nr:unnamed protein product [Rotaria magnacalcarata]
MSTDNKVSTSVNGVATISFHNINYTVGASARPNNCWSKCPKIPCCKPQEVKQVLFNASGCFTRGMNAIMGPSGCGKSSLLDMLADRKDPRGVSGTVLVHGSPRDSSYKYTVGYVVQEDICSGTLTIRENLYFSISLRFPGQLSANQKDERVRAVIEEVGLKGCADTRVGTEFLRGISGGEKKRTCIGMELVLSPEILFLDEPTTGLDASTASSIMNCLKDLSERHRTIIFSIHQPRYSIFKIFDTVMFMCQGRCLYHGSTKDVVPFFSSYDYQCEPYDNPADFALDALIAIGQKPDTMRKLNNIYNTTWENRLSVLPQGGDSANAENLGYKRRQYPVKKLRSLAVEIIYLSQRTLRNTIRNPSLALSQVGVSIILGLLVGLLFYDLKRTTEPGVQNRLAVALIYAILTAVVMMLFSGFILDLSSVFGWLSWIQWISACRYASNILIINEFQGLTFCQPNNTHICPITGEQVIDDLDLPHGTAWDLWRNFIALVFIVTSSFHIIPENDDT